jgi:hypothetical protein
MGDQGGSGGSGALANQLQGECFRGRDGARNGPVFVLGHLTLNQGITNRGRGTVFDYDPGQSPTIHWGGTGRASRASRMSAASRMTARGMLARLVEVMVQATVWAAASRLERPERPRGRPIVAVERAEGVVFVVI